MVLTAKPKKLSEVYRTAECDSTGETEYLLNPLSNAVATHVQGDHLKEVPAYDKQGNLKRTKKGKARTTHIIRAGDVSLDRVRFALKGLKGVQEEDGSSLELKFEQVKIGGRNYSRVRTEVIDRLPDALYTEILLAVWEMDKDEEEDDEDEDEKGSEEDNEDFTSDSSTVNGKPAGTAPEKTTAPTSDESASDEPITEKPEPVQE